MSALIDLTGRRFGRLVVLERAGTYASPDGFHKYATWRCLCDCGNETVVVSQNLRSGDTKSCGCLKTREGKRAYLECLHRGF